MNIIGIDPGKEGAIAILGSQAIELRDCPMMGKGIDALGIVALFAQHKENGSFVAIEKAQSMPGQGVVSVFNYGLGYGLYLGVLSALKIPFQEVHPQAWKKEFGLIGKGKDESIRMARQLFMDSPEVLEKLQFKKDHGRAEALLIAEYGRRKWGR